MQSQIRLVGLFLTLSSVCLCNPVDTDVGRRASHTWLWNSENYPNPKDDYKRCQQQKPSTLCDPDNVLTETDASKVKDLIERLQSRSPCICKEGCVEDAHDKGMIIGVALMNSVYNPLNEDKRETANKMANNLLKKWKLGMCGNDILILVAADKNIGSIQTGDSVKDFLSEETIEDIFEQCKDHFTSGRHYDGIQSIINSLYDKVNQNLLKAPRTAGDGDGDSDSSNVGLTVGLIVGFACLCGLVAAGFVVARRRKRNNQNGFMYDGANGRQGSKNSKREAISPIVKQHVVFPDAIYQPCSVEDTRKTLQTDNQPPSDEEDEPENSDEFYLHNLEENPAYESADIVKSQRPDGNSEAPVAVHNPNNTKKQPLLGEDEKSKNVSV